jgi:8-hydroxy-5-deazaflavin:NADPH oxidoreductase
MTTIGFIGSGNIGSTVAKLAVDAGYDVVVSNSRGPETLVDLVGQLGPRARAGTTAEAAAGDLVVLTVPLKAVPQIPAEPLAGKIVIDTCNYYPDRDGAIADLDEKRTTTSRMVQDHLPEAHVVKAFNNIYFEHLAAMARPAGSGDRNTLLIAGDDSAAKQGVTEFLDTIGYDAFDTGGLDDSWRYQRDQPAYAGAYAEGGDFSKPKRATRDDLQALLDQADRSIR